MTSIIEMPDTIVVVSGLPRSGTSMMMRMLEQGGIEVLTDAVRSADSDNPRGYYEFEPVKRMREDTAWLHQAVGKAVKVISFLLQELPPAFSYKVIFMNRNLEEVLASQRAMLSHRVETAEPEETPGEEQRIAEEDARLRDLYTRHLQQTRLWLQKQPNMSVLDVDHRATLQQPRDVAARVNPFLGGRMNEAAMAQAVYPELYRQRQH